MVYDLVSLVIAQVAGQDARSPSHLVSQQVLQKLSSTLGVNEYHRLRSPQLPIEPVQELPLLLLIGLDLELLDVLELDGFLLHLIRSGCGLVDVPLYVLEGVFGYGGGEQDELGLLLKLLEAMAEDVAYLLLGRLVVEELINFVKAHKPHRLKIQRGTPPLHVLLEEARGGNHYVSRLHLPALSNGHCNTCVPGVELQVLEGLSDKLSGVGDYEYLGVTDFWINSHYRRDAERCSLPTPVH